MKYFFKKVIKKWNETVRRKGIKNEKKVIFLDRLEDSLFDFKIM